MKKIVMFRPLRVRFGISVLVGIFLILSAACGKEQNASSVGDASTYQNSDKSGQEVNVSPLKGMRVVKADTQVTEGETNAISSATQSDVLLIDDFNDGEKPNLIGGNYGAWNRDPLDETQGCMEEFSLENHGVGAGISLKLTYDVESPNPAFNGFWMKLNEIDLSGYKELVFYVRGDHEKGFTRRIKVELKNNIVGEKSPVIIDGITDDWTRFRIPLKQFYSINDWTNISEFVIVFDDEMATKKVGAIFIDDIYFWR